MAWLNQSHYLGMAICVTKQNGFWGSEALFGSEVECKDAVACWGMREWMGHNVGRLLKPLDDSDLEADVNFASDHGDNAGARGLW